MNRKYYDCYSLNLLRFLRENGIEPIRAKTHHKTRNTIWVFLKNEELDTLLTKWSNRRNYHDLQAI